MNMAAGAPKEMPLQASQNPQNTGTSVWAAVKSHMGLRAKPASKVSGFLDIGQLDLDMWRLLFRLCLKTCRYKHVQRAVTGGRERER